jgi:hypothetical protein
MKTTFDPHIKGTRGLRPRTSAFAPGLFLRRGYGAQDGRTRGERENRGLTNTSKQPAAADAPSLVR